MTKANNETHAAAPSLRVGLITDADEAPRYAEAVQSCSALELCAQAGMPQNAALPGLPWFDDTRVLIAQGGLGALVVATSPRLDVNAGDIAATHGVHVWRRPPLGRNFAEAIEVARRLQTVEVVYRVASWWDHVGEDIRWALSLEDGYQPVFSEVQVSAVGPPLVSWRSSQANAGGGVLAYDAYTPLEALIALRGLPEAVVGAIGKCRRRPSEAPRETEDVAVAILHYDEGLAVVRATWDVPPFGHTTHHHGNEASVRYSESAVVVMAADGSILEECSLPTGFLAVEMARFAAEISSEKRRQPAAATIDRHLAVSALVEAIYLSSRTGQPEDPRRLFEVHKWPVPER
jgi:predicted dehydrogenase